MSRLVALAAVAGAACGGPLLITQRPVDLRSLEPAEFVVEAPDPRPVRGVKVRVWVAPAVQVEPDWRAHLIDELDEAAQVLEPLLALRLDFEEPQPWPLPAIAATEVGTGLADLRSRDPGDEAHPWVLGVVAPPLQTTTAMADLAAAEPFARHVVIRAYAAQAEAGTLAARLPDISEAERASVLGAHRRHKQATILLYALARSLGAIDERDGTKLQSPTYDPTIAGVSPRNLALMRLGLEARLTGGEPVEVARALLGAIDEPPWGGWLDGDRDARSRLLRAVIDAKLAEAVVGAVPGAALEQFQRAQGMAAAGAFERALAELEPLIAAYPANPTLRLLACQITLGRDGASLPAPAPCARVVELAPADIGVYLALAQAWLAKPDPAQAHAALDTAARVLAARATAAPLDEWQRILAVYRAMGAITWTEALLARPELAGRPEVADAATWARQTRVRYGATAGAADPSDEGALVATVKAVLDQVNTDQFKAAAAALAVADKRWPRAAGLATMRCELEFRQQRLGPARKACTRALALAPETSWALYLLGVMDLQGDGKARALGMTRLRAAIAADPDLGQAWRTLGKALARYGTADELARLRADHQARFGRAL